MSNGSVFPYGITLREGGVLDVIPVVEVSVFSQEGDRLSLFLLIDSGAAISVFPSSDALALGVSLESSPDVAIAGIDGRLVRGWRQSLLVQIGGVQRRVPVVFLDNTNAPRILGREGVFEHFSVVFEESNRRSALLQKGGKEATVVKRILDTIR